MPQNLGANHPLQTPTTTTTLSSSAGPVDISFSFINNADVLVFLDGTLRTNGTGNNNYTINTAKTQVTFNNDVSGDVIITRKSDLLTKVRTFTAGSSVRAADLNTQFDQVMQLIQDNYEMLRSVILNDDNDEITVGRDSLIANNKVRTESIQDNAVTLSKIAAGNADQVLITSGGEPTWSNDVDVQGTLDVTGTTTLDGSLNVAGNADLNGALDVDGDTELDDVDIDGTLEVVGNATFASDVDLGNSAADTITINGEVDSNIVPEADGTRHLGSSTKRWHTVHADNIEATTISDDARITASEQVAHAPDDTTYYTTSAADQRFWRQDTAGNEIVTGTSWTSNDSRVATTAAIDNRITTLVDNIGGFVPIANETSFPTANPDIDNDAGTIVSIASLANDLTFNSSGQATITNGAGSGNNVTITGGPASTTIEDGVGMLVETTSTLHTYTWHRTTPDGTNVREVANDIGNVNTVATNIADINALEDVIADIQTLADIEDGTVDEDAISDLAAIASNVTTCADNIADINTVANDLNEDTSEIETVAGSIDNVDAVGGSINNVNTVATNINNVNSFSQTYQVSNSAPSSPDAGDLWWDTSQDPQLLKAYDETNTQWVAVTTDQDAGLQTSGGTMTGAIILDDGRDATAPVLTFTGDSNTGLFSSGADSVDVTANGATRLQVTGTAIKSTLPTEVEVTTTTTNAVTRALLVESQSSGTPAAGIGVGIDFAVETAAANNEIGAQIEAVTTDVSNGGEDFDLVVNLMEGGTAAAEKLRITSAGTIQSANNTDLTLAGGGTGNVVVNDDLTIADGKNLKLQNDDEDQTVTINADDCSGSYTVTLPPTQPSADGQVLRVASGGNSNDAELEWGTISQSTISAGTANVECVDSGSNDHITFDTESEERMRIDKDGIITVAKAGHVAPTSGTANLALLNVIGDASSQGNAATLNLWHNDAPNSDEDLGTINFLGESDTGVPAAQIKGRSDGSWNDGGDTSDHPGELQFLTTPNTSSVPAVRMTIQSDGNVGIGENSPAAAVHVKKDAGDLLRLDRENTGAVGNQIAFRHSNSGTLTETGSVNCVSTANAATGELRFSTKASGGSNAEKMRLDSAGRLLLNSGSDVRIELGTNGTTATNDRNHLRADGDNLKYNCCDDGNHIFEENGGERMRITSAGNVGIGDTNPTRALCIKYDNDTVYSESAHAPDAGSLRIFNNSTTAGCTAGEVLLGARETGSAFASIAGISPGSQEAELSFRISDSATLAEAMRIDKSGKVGIGTTTPSVELEVSGTGAIEIPQGTTAQRPAGSNAARAGLIRYNTETDMPEFFNEISNSWATVGVKGGMVKTADPTIPDEIIEQTSVTVTNPTVIGGSGTISFTYQWMVELSGTYTNIPSGTSQSVTLPEQVDSTDVLGNNVRCTVTATDGDGFTLVLNTNETEVTEFKPNMNPPAGIAVNWNPGSNSGGEASSIGYANLPNNEKAIDVTWGATYHTTRYVLSDAGKIYTFNRQGTGTMSVTHQTGNSYEWSGKTLQGFCFADAASRPIQIATTGELRLSTDSGSNWTEWLTTTSGFSKVLWHSGCDNHTKTMAVTEDGKVRFATTHANFYNLDGTTSATVSPTFMGEYITPPSGKKICYVTVVNNGTYGAVLLCNDQRLYAVGNTHVSGFPTNGTRSTPVIVSGVTTKFKQIGNFGNTGNSNQGFQAIDVDGNYWCCRANNSDSFSKHFDSTGVTIKSLFGAQLAPYIDNCCTYNQRDLMAIGADKILWTNNLPAGGTTLAEYNIPSSFPSWDHTKTDHGGRTVMTSDHSGDWASIILPQ